MASVGFVGLGRMGRPMAQHLVAAGHGLIGIDPSAEARSLASTAGIEVTDDLGAIAGASVVISSLPDTPEVQEVYSDSLFQALAPDALCLDMSTIDVAVSQAIAEDAREAGHSFLDCPVSGTSIHAEEGSVVVMVGGSHAAAERATPYLETFSRAVHHVGGNGMGLEMKLVTNRLLTSHVVAIAEAILEMERAGLDTGAGLALLSEGAVPRLLDYKAPPMAERDHTPLFTVDLMSKDLKLARERRHPLPVGAASGDVMALAQFQGYGALDISAVIEVLSSRAHDIDPE